MTKRQSEERLRELLAGSLAVWGLAEAVTLALEDGEAVLSAADGTAVRVTRIGGTWRVAAGGRESEHAGVPGMLRALRRALAPEQRPGRMIVAPAPGRE